MNRTVRMPNRGRKMIDKRILKMHELMQCQHAADTASDEAMMEADAIYADAERDAITDEMTGTNQPTISK